LNRSRVLDAAALERRGPHQMRHTFASLLIQQGESLAYVRDQLGHKSIQITSTCTAIWCRAATAARSIASMIRNPPQPRRNQGP